jgi:hypothetical protein
MKRDLMGGAWRDQKCIQISEGRNLKGGAKIIILV